MNIKKILYPLFITFYSFRSPYKVDEIRNEGDACKFKKKGGGGKIIILSLWNPRRAYKWKNYSGLVSFLRAQEKQTVQKVFRKEGTYEERSVVSLVPVMKVY